MRDGAWRNLGASLVSERDRAAAAPGRESDVVYNSDDDATVHALTARAHSWTRVRVNRTRGAVPADTLPQ
jgi:hypothetical protein